LTVTLKYKTDQTNIVVEPLREMHGMVKSAVITEFVRILPNTTKSIIKKLCKGNSAFPKNYSELVAVDRTAEDVEQFENMARERLEDLMTFGGSEESHDSDSGKSKMVSFPPPKVRQFLMPNRIQAELTLRAMNCFSFVYLFKPCRYTKAGRDGGSDFDKAWTINANASIKNDMARRIQLKPLCFTAPG
jgi:hypothetical protein